MEREVMKNTPVAGFIQVTNKKRFCYKDHSVCIMEDNRKKLTVTNTGACKYLKSEW